MPSTPSFPSSGMTSVGNTARSYQSAMFGRITSSTNPRTFNARSRSWAENSPSIPVRSTGPKKDPEVSAEGAGAGVVLFLVMPVRSPSSDAVLGGRPDHDLRVLVEAVALAAHGPDG